MAYCKHDNFRPVRKAGAVDLSNDLLDLPNAFGSVGYDQVVGLFDNAHRSALGPHSELKRLAQGFDRNVIKANQLGDNALGRHGFIAVR